MTKYVAFLRGIMPSNPKMRNENLRHLFEEIGFSNVKTVISSGNVIFESTLKNTQKIEEVIEKALPEKLGFKSTTIIRSQADLKKLIAQEPFKGMEHSKTSYLNVTFLKHETNIELKLPYKVADRDYTVLDAYQGAVCSVIDVTTSKTPNLMIWLERKLGKEITTRTWKTVEKIVKVMES